MTKGDFERSENTKKKLNKILKLKVRSTKLVLFSKSSSKKSVTSKLIQNSLSINHALNSLFTNKFKPPIAYLNTSLWKVQIHKRIQGFNTQKPTLVGFHNVKKMYQSLQPSHCTMRSSGL